MTARPGAYGPRDLRDPGKGEPIVSDGLLYGPGEEIFVYDGGPGLVTRHLGWALSVVEMAFGDGPSATRSRRVVVFRDADGNLDVSSPLVVSPLGRAATAWHMVAPDGRIVGGGTRAQGRRDSLTRAELEALRDTARYDFLAGSRAVYGIPEGAAKAPHSAPAGQDGSFPAARGGRYVWCDA